MNINFKPIEDELQGYLKFEPGWDGYRAEPFHKDLVDRVQYALNLVNELYQSTDKYPDSIAVGPASDGSIGLEIKMGDRELTLDFCSGNYVEVHGSQKESAVTYKWKWPIDLNWNLIEKELRWLFYE